MGAEPQQKLLYVITKAAPWGGAQKYVYDLATRAVSEYDVAVVVGGSGPLVNRLEESGIRTIPVYALKRDISFLKEVQSFFALLRIFWRECPDVVHVNSSKAAGLGVVAARCVRVPRVIFTAHGWAFTESRRRFARLLITFFSWLTVLFTHKTITVSEYHQALMARMPFVKRKLVTIYNGIEEPVFFEKTKARRLLAAQAGIPQGLWQRKLWIGTVSELHPNKGLPYLLYAIDAVRETQSDIVVVIVSEGEERSHLEEIIDRLGLRETVFLTGYVTSAAQYLKAFDVFTLTSIKEGLPYTILEAGLAKVPVIASRIDGIPEIISSQKLGILVQPKRPEKITQELIALIENSKKRTVLGEALQERVIKHFSQEAMVAKTLAVYGK